MRDTMIITIMVILSVEILKVLRLGMLGNLLQFREESWKWRNSTRVAIAELDNGCFRN